MIRPETSICDVVMIHRSTPPEEHMAEKPIDDEEFEAPDLEIDLEADDVELDDELVEVLDEELVVDTSASLATIVRRSRAPRPTEARG